MKHCVSKVTIMMGNIIGYLIVYSLFSFDKQCVFGKRGSILFKKHKKCRKNFAIYK